MNKIELTIGNYESFLNKIFQNMKNAGFDDAEFSEIDHLAYRTETPERYEELKKEFEKFSNDMSEVIISDRSIAIYKLKDPLIYKSWKVNCIELCAPKEDNKHKEGLEHAEFVTKVSLEDFMERHVGLQFDMKAFEKEINRELVLDFDDCAVKFHEQSLLGIRGM